MSAKLYRALSSVLAVISPLALAACGSASSSAPDTGDEQDITEGTPNVSFVGSYSDLEQRADNDFGSLDLHANGTYAAHVLATAAGLKVLCVRAPCNVPETGTWTTTKTQDGVVRLRLKPESTPVRIYRSSNGDSASLSVERKTSTQTLRLVETDRIVVGGSYTDHQQNVTSDFGSVTFKADGTYSAQVLTSVTATKIVCNRAPCNAPETGTWSLKAGLLTVTPKGSIVRNYIASNPSDPSFLRIESRPSSQTLQIGSTAR